MLRCIITILLYSGSLWAQTCKQFFAPEIKFYASPMSIELTDFLSYPIPGSKIKNYENVFLNLKKVERKKPNNYLKLMQFLRIIQIVEHRDLKIHVIVKDIKIDYKRLSRMFDKVFGVTPSYFIRVFEIYRIHLELIGQDHSSRNIYRTIMQRGFSHPERVSRTYKELFGYSPRFARSVHLYESNLREYFYK